MKNEPIVILAGGDSRRAGIDKAVMMTTCGLNALDYQVQQAQSLSSETWVSGPKRPTQYPVKWLKDKTGSGPLAGILAALVALESGYITVLPIDTPLVSPGVLLKLRQSLSANIIAFEDQPLVGRWYKSEQFFLEQALVLGKFDVVPYIESRPHRWLGDSNLENLNTQQEWQEFWQSQPS